MPFPAFSTGHFPQINMQEYAKVSCLFYSSLVLIVTYSFCQRKKGCFASQTDAKWFFLVAIEADLASRTLSCSTKHQVFTELTFFPWFSGWFFLRFVTLPFGMRCMCFLQRAVMSLAIAFECINFVNTIFLRVVRKLWSRRLSCQSKRPVQGYFYLRNAICKEMPCRVACLY